MPSRSLNQIKNSINSYEYDDELLIAIDFGTVLDENLTADVIDDTLIVSYKQPNASDQDIEFNLPSEFTNPTVSINNGIITISQPVPQDPTEAIEEAEEGDDLVDEVDLEDETDTVESNEDSEHNSSEDVGNE